MKSISNILRTITLVALSIVFATMTSASAQNDSFSIIPKVDPSVISGTAKELSEAPKRQFRATYNEKAKDLKPEEQIATGVMTWDTLIDYAAILIQFISQLGLVAGSACIIIAGYQYGMYAFYGKGGKLDAIKYAFYGIAIIASSYGIFRLLTVIFIE